MRLKVVDEISGREKLGGIAPALSSYVNNPDGSIGIIGYDVYKDASNAEPTDGIGGEPTIDFYLNTVNPLNSGFDFKIDKPASDVQGEGVSLLLLPIKRADKGKTLYITFDKDGSDANFTRESLGLFAYDVTNAQLIPMTSGSNIINNSARQKGSFIVPANCDEVRIILHVKESSTDSWSFQFTNLEVSSKREIGPSEISPFLENLKHRLLSSYFDYVTPIVFEAVEEELTDSATALFDTVNGAYSFGNASEALTTIQLFDEEFLGLDLDGRSIELHAEWLDVDSSDLNATYEVSLNGVAFEAVQMERQGKSTKFVGTKTLAIPSNALITEQDAGTTDTELNATTVTEVEKSINLTSKYAARELTIEIDKLGTPSGSYIVSIHKDASGNPGEVVYSVNRLVSELSSGLNALTFDNFRAILPVGTYHIVVSTDSAYKAAFSTGVNSIRVKTDSGDLKHSLSGHIFDLRVRVESSAGGKKLSSLGVFHGEASGGSLQYGYSQIQKFKFLGNDDVTEFQITNFLPNPDHLKVYDITSAQVYRYPAFSINGSLIKFPDGTFSVPDEEIELFFDQSEGSGYDYSDTNANLLASNHLGSEDTTIDKSTNGRGLFLRNSNGELKEVWLDEDNVINVTNPKG
jgi:hypothetical protein